jgi:hypothetical protein
MLVSRALVEVSEWVHGMHIQSKAQLPSKKADKHKSAASDRRSY